MPTWSAWKKAEVAAGVLLGGVRMRGSGGPTERRTYGDLVAGDPDRDDGSLCMLPDWLYAEVKRRQDLERLRTIWDREKKEGRWGPKMLLTIAHRIRSGMAGGLTEDYIFANGTVWAKDGFGPAYGVRREMTGKVAVVAVLDKAQTQAEKEGKRVAVVAQRFHRRPGIFVFVKSEHWPDLVGHLRNVFLKQGEERLEREAPEEVFPKCSVCKLHHDPEPGCGWCQQCRDFHPPIH